MKYKKSIIITLIVAGIVIVVLGGVKQNKTIQVSNRKEMSIEEAIHKAILSNEDKGEYDFTCEFNYILQSDLGKGDKSETTIYTMVTIINYEIKDNIFKKESSDYFPLAITFIKEGNNYVLKEYWKPRKDTNFIPDLEEKFPKLLVQTAIGEPKFKVEDIQKCYEELIQYGDIDTEKMISQIIDDRVNGNGFIIQNAQKPEIDELIYFGDYMLDYSFKRFSQGDVDGKAANIMSDVCKYILNQNNEDIISSDIQGEEWFNAYYKEIKEIKEEKGMEYIKSNMPKSYKLIEERE